MKRVCNNRPVHFSPPNLLRFFDIISSYTIKEHSFPEASNNDFYYSEDCNMSLESKFEVTAQESGRFISNCPFDEIKSLQTQHGYSGYLIGQALVVAIKSSPEGFTPHSLNSLFTNTLDAGKVINWETDEINNGKTFVNRTIRAVQNGRIVYIANVSLSRRNSIREANQKYQEYIELKKGDDDDDDEGQAVKKPFGFQTPFPKWLKEYTPDNDKLTTTALDELIELRVPPQLDNFALAKSEGKQPVTNRKLSLYAKLTPTSTSEKGFNYLGLALISDSVMLSKLRRILRIDDTKTLYTNKSIRRLDHLIYFHDVDFDPSNWVAFSFNILRISNNRALLEGEIFNEQGVHVCTVFQEGLVTVSDLELRARL